MRGDCQRGTKPYGGVAGCKSHGPGRCWRLGFSTTPEGSFSLSLQDVICGCVLMTRGFWGVALGGYWFLVPDYLRACFCISGIGVR